jgi:translation initiation factor 2B subunit (eIF-2B alpha/beta/delta family)
MDTRIADRITDIKNDKIHGAGYLTEQAISTIIISVTENPLPTVSELQNEISIVSAKLQSARPTMVSIANSIALFNKQIQESFKREIDTDTFKHMVKNLGNSYIHEMERAAEKAAGYGADVVNDGSTIITCSSSSMVAKAIVVTKERGNNINIYIAESQWANMAYGQLMADELKKQSISSIVISDRDIKKYLHHTTTALIGADCILNNGAVVNGIPSLKIAREASSSKLRFYVICETAKFDIRNTRGDNPDIEEGFDVIPPELITGLITERGIISPSEIRYFLSEITSKPN